MTPYIQSFIASLPLVTSGPEAGMRGPITVEDYYVGRPVTLLSDKAEPDEIELFRVDAGRGTGRHLAGKLAGFQEHRVLAAAHRQANLEALGVDQIGFRGQADEMDRMTAEQQF